MTGNELMAALEQLQHDHPEWMNNTVFFAEAFAINQVYTVQPNEHGIWLE